MQINEIDYKDARPIDAYAADAFRIGDELYHGTICVTANEVLPWGGVEDSELVAALQGQVDVLLLGCGDSLQPVPAALRAAATAAGIGIEPMSTPSACRTFNVLLAEGRRVAAALVPLEASA